MKRRYHTKQNDDTMPDYQPTPYAPYPYPPYGYGPYGSYPGYYRYMPGFGPGYGQMPGFGRGFGPRPGRPGYGPGPYCPYR